MVMLPVQWATCWILVYDSGWCDISPVGFYLVAHALDNDV